MLVKKKILLTTLALFIGFLGVGTASALTKNSMLYSLTITFGTTFYHFAMRLAVGCGINAKFHHRMDYTKVWFREKGFESKLYQYIMVKKWKKWFPSFNPQDFMLKKSSVTDIIQVTCQAEIVHEIIMVLSFVPVLFSIWFGAAEVFFITSCIACLFDGIFVVLQRYNRPRLMRLAERQQIIG